MKCPKCGFVSHPGLAQCKKCGASLAPAPHPPSMVTKTSPIVQPGPVGQDEDKAKGPPSANMNPSQSKAPRDSWQDKRPQAKSGNPEPEFDPDLSEPPAGVALLPQVPEPSPWRQELTERVQSFRQRRARLRNEPHQGETLDFELDRSETQAPLELGVEKILEFPQNHISIDAEIAPRGAFENDAADSDTEAPQRNDGGFEILDSAPPRAEEIALESESRADNRLKIVIEPPEVGAPAAASQLELEELIVAPMGRRFLAGLVDGLVLLLGGGLFTLIFWKAGGHLTPVPPNLAIVAFIAVIFVWAYFGLFTALTFSTPGQTWMGMEVRNMEGWPPAPRESLMRAFGYLVSLSALMIGFFWALVDSDGLTWHDRISGTFLTPVKAEAPPKGAESKP